MGEEQDGNAGSAPAAYPLEQPQRLSQSILWKLQRRYFERAGMGAWSQNEVPSWVTSNPFIAAAYATVVAAYLGGSGTARPAQGLDGEQPVYVIELGAGSGRFAHHFLRAWSEAESRTGGERAAAHPALCYVMTEYNPALIESWERHPALQPWIAAGRLDCAHFDAEHPAELVLRHRRARLAPGASRNPLVVIANYFFDSVPQDAFYVDGGRLYESRASLTSSQPEADGEDPGLLARARLVYERRPLGDREADRYYGEPELDATLATYRERLGESGLAFPSAALRCLAYLRRVGNGLLLLTSDKGYHRAEDLQGRREPGFEVHGSFSMGVNYEALGQYFRMQGGEALCLPHRHLYLDTCAFLVGDPPGGSEAVRRAFAAAIGEFGPEDVYLLRSVLDHDHSPWGVEALLALLRLSRWDPKIWQSCFSDLLSGLPEAAAAVQEELRQGAARLWANHYHIGESYDLPYDLGIMLYNIGDYAQAVEYFRHSLALYGPAAQALYNIGLCYYMLRDPETALRCVQEATRLDPSFEPALAMQRRIEGDGATAA